MPQVDLTALSGQELRQRLDSSRARGDAALAYEILREMAARREAQASRRTRARRRAGEPHLVSVDLGDPLDRDDDDLPPMPNWRPPAEVTAATPADPSAPLVLEEEDLISIPPPPPPTPPEPPVLRLVEPEPQPELEVDIPEDVPPDLEVQPQAMTEPETTPVADPAPAAELADWDLRLRPGEIDRAPPRRRSGLPLTLGFAAGISAGLALGWFAWGTGEAPWRAAAPAAAPVEVAEAPPPPPAFDAAPPPAPAPPVEAATAAPPELAEAPAEAPAVEAPAPVEVAAAAPESTPASANCAAEPTPADRRICADPALQRLQQDLRQAYAEALDAHQDRTTLRQRQLAWRDGRNTVTDPAQLTRLYEQRIQRLRAATAEARAQR